MAYLPVSGVFGNVSDVPSAQIFSSTANRDAYFSANPDKLIVGTPAVVLTNPPEGLYQVFTGTEWQNRTAVIVGPKGDEPFTTVKVTMLPAGSTATSVINGDELDLGIPRAAQSPAVRQAVRFLGMFETESELNLQEPNPREGSQCIVLTPEQHYYEFTSGVWVKGRSVGDAHSGYLGRYADEAALTAAHPTAPTDSTAIAGKAWFIYETNAWEPLQDDHIPAIDNKLQSLEAGQGVLRSDLDEKISGVHVEDSKGNSYDDITGFDFGDSAELGDPQGSQKVPVNVKPKITVANGQEPGSTSVTGNAIVIDGSNVSNDPNDPDVIILDIPSASGGLELDNGVANITGVTKINVPTSELLAKGGGEVDLIPYFKGKSGDTEALIEELRVLPPMQLNPQQGEQYKYDLIIDPRAYEPQHSASCLLRLGKDEFVNGGQVRAVYCDQEIIPTGEYFSLNAAARGLNVQDNTGGDTALTGGELTEILASVGFFGKAPEDGNIKVWIKYVDQTNPLPQDILLDTNGQPVLFERSYKAGDDLNTGGVPIVLAGAMYAKGQSPITLMVETSFSQLGSVIVNPDKTMLCVNQFKDGYETSVARIEFQRRCGVEITPSIHKFENIMSTMRDEIVGVTQVTTVFAPGEGEDLLNSFGVNNLTTITASILNEVLTLADNAGQTADFYLDAIIDADRTTMLRGKEMSTQVLIDNPDSAFNLAMYKWVGKADQPSKLYSSRNNGSIVLNDGWALVGTKFIAENTAGNYVASLLLATVPDDAVNIGFFLYPVDSQSPLTLNVRDFNFGSETEFTGYVEVSRLNVNERHLGFDESYGEFTLNNQGYASLRYTINNTPTAGNPMPVGELVKGKAPVERDGTVNQVAGSADPQNDGAIKFLKDGQASISKSYLVRNETGTDSTVTFWDVLFDAGGVETKIPESEKTFTVKANTGAPGVVFTIPAYIVEVETGQRVGGRATSNKVDGAYVQSNASNQYLVQTIIDFEEFVVEDVTATSDILRVVSITQDANDLKQTLSANDTPEVITFNDVQVVSSRVTVDPATGIFTFNTNESLIASISTQIMREVSGGGANVYWTLFSEYSDDNGATWTPVDGSARRQTMDGAQTNEVRFVDYTAPVVGQIGRMFRFMHVTNDATKLVGTVSQAASGGAPSSSGVIVGFYSNL